jgi:hypothetical protein
MTRIENRKRKNHKAAKTLTNKNSLTPAEKRTNRLLIEANLRFMRSGIQIKDVYGRLED